MFSDNFIKVLNKLKVTENLLSDTEKENLDAKGFIILENYLSTDLTNKILNNIEDIFFKRKDLPQEYKNKTTR